MGKPFYIGVSHKLVSGSGAKVEVNGYCAFDGNGVFTGGIFWFDSENNAEDYPSAHPTNCIVNRDKTAAVIDFPNDTVLEVKGQAYSSPTASGIKSANVTGLTLRGRNVLETPIE